MKTIKRHAWSITKYALVIFGATQGYALGNTKHTGQSTFTWRDWVLVSTVTSSVVPLIIIMVRQNKKYDILEKISWNSNVFKKNQELNGLVLGGAFFLSIGIGTVIQVIKSNDNNLLFVGGAVFSFGVWLILASYIYSYLFKKQIKK